MACPVCGDKDGACHGSVPVRLTADQLADIGLKPEQVKTGGTIVMADQNEPKARYPRQEVAQGQKHGYIGEVETYDPPQSGAGYSNAETPKPGKSTTTKTTAASTTPAEKPIVGATGVVDDSVDNVEQPKS